MKFFHPNEIYISDLEFIAGWIGWFKEFGPCNQDWTVDSMPVRNVAAGLNEQLRNYGVFTCDVLCRILRKNNRDTMQATPVFRDYKENSNIIETFNEHYLGANRSINTVRVTENAIELWRSSTKDERLNAFNSVYSLIADDEFVFSDEMQQAEEVVNIDPVSNFDSVNINLNTYIAENLDNRTEYVMALVKMIHEEPYQPMYRKRPIGNYVTGWGNRLRAYFWPTPEIGLVETADMLQPIIDTCSGLASLVERNEPWNQDAQDSAVQVANDIFRWGGVPQSAITVTADNIRMVFENAIADKVTHNNALMNSGWTKVAAFASHNTINQQVIWDSRVSVSLVSRLDTLINENQNHLAYFQDIGYVPGRGGFRQYKLDNLRLNWPNGYRQWAAQIAGSRLVREMVEALNDPQNAYPRMPDLATGDELTEWSSRGVEMVLFGDGY